MEGARLYVMCVWLFVKRDGEGGGYKTVAVSLVWNLGLGAKHSTNNQ